MYLTSKLYTGFLSSNVLTCNLKCPDYPPSLHRKQIIFVVDTSGSMTSTLPHIRHSLLAVRNCLLRLHGEKVDTMTEEDRDHVFASACCASLITFNGTAKTEWTHKDQTDFSSAIQNLSAEGTTNMGDGLQLAFDHVSNDHITWIIVLTDGIPNRGSCQTKSSFEHLMTTLPPRTKIIPLGYTTKFNPQILSVLGSMTYVQSEEFIPEIMGNISAEIATCYGIDAEIILPKITSPIPDPEDDIVVPPKIQTPPRNIIGSPTIGCLFNQREYTYGRLIPSTDYIGLYATFKYLDIDTMQTVSSHVIIQEGGDDIPDEIYEQYFNSSKGQLLGLIYQMRSNPFHPKNAHMVDKIHRKINGWTHPAAVEHREEIIRTLSCDRLMDADQTMQGLTTTANIRDQTGYINASRYTTPFQRGISADVTLDASAYAMMDQID